VEKMTGGVTVGNIVGVFVGKGVFDGTAAAVCAMAAFAVNTTIVGSVFGSIGTGVGWLTPGMAHARIDNKVMPIARWDLVLMDFTFCDFAIPGLISPIPD